MRQWQPLAGSRVPYRIVFEMGLKKDPRSAFLLHHKLRNEKLGLDQGWALGHKRESTFFFQNLDFFGMPRSEQGVPRTSGAKTKPRGNSSLREIL